MKFVFVASLRQPELSYATSRFSGRHIVEPHPLMLLPFVTMLLCISKACRFGG